MCEKLDFCLLLIRVQGGIEDYLNVGRGESAGVLGHGSCSEGEKGLVPRLTKISLFVPICTVLLLPYSNYCTSYYDTQITPFQ